ncbi:hypothetical protein F53441_11887 [Fusarium austroafricanum]|uniref:Uncharacterized protein n=1 Tax=Fusarium austroafricanum TaxID=2364996 RepID=A0A8H4K1S8_9HYPO|nr:hypothetical protein F53441_11887 [Fusarium austroafricanum]
MPPAEKKWDANAERDLCVAIIMGAQDGERMRYNWPKVHASMDALGYSFTKDAISQHFSKSIMRDFKTRHGETSTSASPTPTSKKTPRKRATPSKSRKKKVESDDDGSIEDTSVYSPIAKKMKRNKEEEDDDDDVKMSSSTQGKREPSPTPSREPSKFEKWLDNGDGV